MKHRAASHNAIVIEQFSLQAVPFAAVPGHSSSIAMLVEMAQVSADDSVLDVACGPGLVACEFARQAKHVTGIDITPKMIDEAHARQTREQLPNMSWQVGDALPLPFASCSFDVVITRYSFHHFVDPAAVLHEMVRVCKPGGRVVVADVALPADKLDAYDRLEKMRDPSHVRVLEISEMAHLMNGAGLDGLRVGRYKVESTLDEMLKASFPDPRDVAAISEMLHADLGKDALGIDAHLEDGRLHYAVPILVIAGIKPAAASARGQAM